MAPERRRRRSAVAVSNSPVVARPTITPPALHVIPGGAARAERIRDVRARILAGYYDRLDVRSRLADAVLRQMRRG